MNKQSLFFVRLMSFSTLFLSVSMHAAKGQLFASVAAANRDPYFTVTNRDRFAALKTEYGFATHENRRGNNKKAAYPNQDRAFAGTILGKEFFIVCDGHGSQGDRIASEVINVLPKKVLGARSASSGFFAACDSLQKFFASVGYAQHSGTTMVGAVIQDKKLIVGHVGDSRLILVRGGCVVAKTEDHSTKNKAECERIKNANGVIIAGYVYGNDHKHGLAVTRSLGDVAAHDGQVISCQPTVSEHLLEDGDYIVLASDGYWDVSTPDETAQFLANNKQTSCNQLAQQLVAQAVAKESRDDITVLVVRYCSVK